MESVSSSPRSRHQSSEQEEVNWKVHKYAKDSQTKICKDIKNENTLACIHENLYSNQTEMYMCYGLQFPPNLWCTENVFGEIQKYTYNQK